jgi:16S rRNA (uracil1498-N3)-methyltransferase
MDISEIDLLFYADRVEAGKAYLSQDETHHAMNVLRKNSGEEIFITDGAGMYYKGTLLQSRGKEAAIEISDSLLASSPHFHLHLAVAPTKSFDRMEWCIEKLTEIGASSFTPLYCERSERTKWNERRAKKIAVSAMKQSLRAFLPACNSPQKIDHFIDSPVSAGSVKYIALQDPQSVIAAKHYSPGSDVLIMIGPEGDFSKKEVEAAFARGFIPLSLGQHRLRTETAAVVAAAIIHGLNQH